MSGRDTHAEQQAIVTAACAWAGAMEAMADIRREASAGADLSAGQRHVDGLADRLLEAVNAYLADRGGS